MHSTSLRSDDPRDRLDVQRVQREERGDERARPTRRSSAAGRGTGARRVRRVQQRVDEVVAPGVEPEELDVEHVREPGQRVPVRGRGSVKAQRTPVQVRPARTCGLRET